MDTIQPAEVMVETDLVDPLQVVTPDTPDPTNSKDKLVQQIGTFVVYGKRRQGMSMALYKAAVKWYCS